eukprot:1963900-Rhodomonas_salina.2
MAILQTPEMGVITTSPLLFRDNARPCLARCCIGGGWFCGARACPIGGLDVVDLRPDGSNGDLGGLGDRFAGTH